MSLKKPEQKFNARLLKIFREAGADAVRIENATQSGMPDINVCLNGSEVWIESKVQSREDEDPILRKEQYAWMMRRVRANGRCYVVHLSMDHNLYVYDMSGCVAIVPRGDGKTLWLRSIHQGFFLEDEDLLAYLFLG